MTTRDALPLRWTAFWSRMVVRSMLASLAASLLLLAGSVAAQAQQAARVYRIGLVAPGAPLEQHHAFRERLRELGYVEGRNLVVEARFAQGRVTRTAELVADRLALKVGVLLVGSTVCLTSPCGVVLLSCMTSRLCPANAIGLELPA